MRQKSGKTFQRVQESQDVVLNDGEETGKRRSKTFKEMMADRLVYWLVLLIMMAGKLVIDCCNEEA